LPKLAISYIREAKATPTELRFEHAIFFVEIGDDLLLMTLSSSWKI
jgi:hypothetical protein